LGERLHPTPHSTREKAEQARVFLPRDGNAGIQITEELDLSERFTKIRVSRILAFGWALSQPLFAQWHPQPDPAEGTVDFQSSNLPVIWIDTHGLQISDDPRIIADMGVIDNGAGLRNRVTDFANAYRGRIAIELRGRSSQSYPQKPYRFETQDSLGNNLNVSLLGLPKENDWVLYAPFVDESLIRNVIAYGISNGMGRFATRTRFCELVLNGDYRGIYVLMEKIKRDKNRVDIAAMDVDDVAGDSLTGGYIIKIDQNTGENIGGWRSSKGLRYQYDYPRPDRIVPEQAAYIRDFIDEFEQAMTDDWTAGPQPAYLRVIDGESFVDHFIINEFCKNVDAYRISAFMHKDRDSKGGKLVMGPVWDMDLSMANAYYWDDFDLTEGWEVDYRLRRPWDGALPPFWWEKLAHDPSFEAPASARWRELRTGLLRQDRLYSMIDSLVALTAEARGRHFRKWPGVLNGETHEDRILRLKQWISARLYWIDANIGNLSGPAEKNGEPGSPADFCLYPNYPNPFNTSTTIDYHLPFSTRVVMVLCDRMGRETRTLVDEIQIPGRHRVLWDGLDGRGRTVGSGAYVVRMKAGGRLQTRKLMLLR